MSCSAPEFDSVEREAVMRVHYGTNVPIGILTAQLNALPGDAMTVADVREYARSLGLRRLPGSSMTLSSVRSPARDEVLRRLYPTLSLNADILKELNRLPGKPVTLKQLCDYAAILGVRRSPNYVSMVAKRNPYTVPPPAPAGSVAREWTDVDVVLDWGRSNGVALSGDVASDIAAVNAAREAYGLPGFLIRKRAA